MIERIDFFSRKGKDDRDWTPFFLVKGKGDWTKILVIGGED